MNALEARRKVFYYGWIILAASLAVGMVSFGIRYSFGIFFNSLEKEFDLSRTAVSGIFSAHMILCCIASVSGGWALDRFGPRLVSLGMGLLTGLSLILSSQVHSAWQLYISYSLVLALGTGALFSIVNTTTSRWFIKKRGMAIGFTTSAGAIGQIIFAPFSTWLISHYDWRLSFLLLGVLAWVILIPASLLMKRDPADVGLLPDGLQPSASAATSKTPMREEGLSLGEAWKVREFWLLGFTWLLLSVAVHMILTHATPHAIDLGISAIEASVIISLIGVGSVLGRLVDGKISDRTGRKPPAIAGGILLVLALTAVIFMRDRWMFYVFGLVFGYGWGSLGSQVTLLIGDIFGVRSLGLIMGTVTLGWNIGAALGPELGGMVFDIAGAYSWAFALTAAGMAAATFMTFIMRPEKAYGR